MNLFSETEFSKAVRKLFERLNQIAMAEDGVYADGFFKAYVFGGAAVHLYTNSRSSHDVDVEFSRYLPAFREEDVVVSFVDENGRPQQLTFDENFSSTLGMLHENYQEDAVPFFTEPGQSLWVYLVSPLDLAVSKLGRLAGHDLEDIKALAGMGLISAEGVRERAEFALAAYVGNTDRAKTNIDIAVKTIKSIGK